ncbi:MAG: ABC transporter ATP-binding protein [Bdellovibrionaceae bacterium]|nr:ABC transporter ATP-binding protein [Pseudobdellovibrionaceae bacterium]
MQPGSAARAWGETLIQAQVVTKSYPMGTGRLEILKGIDLEIRSGDALCIVGSSGAGKSTLLHILGTLDRPTLGKVLYRGQDLTKKSDDELAAFRNVSMGFVFQFHHLMAEFTALENVMMPCRIAGASPKDARAAAEELLTLLGLAQRLHHHPSELSGGEQQRVAIARALVRKPEVLFADEPTGNLDTVNGEKIQDLFFELKQKMNLTLVVVTHDEDFAKKFPKVLHMRDGHWL